MKDRTLPIIAIAASIIAVIISFTHGDGDKANDTSALDRLEQRLRRLESKVDASTDSGERKLSALSKTDAVMPEGDDESIADLHDRQSQLEEELTELGVFDHFAARKKKIEDSYAAALDSELGTKSRLEALKILRQAKRIDDAVVSSMVTMWGESLEDEKGGGWTRWFLMENIEGTQSPEFRDSILEWIPGEESAKMRGHAVETLASMRPDPAVDEWLDYLGQNDPEPKIRELATAIQQSASENK